MWAKTIKSCDFVSKHIRDLFIKRKARGKNSRSRGNNNNNNYILGLL